MFDEDARRSWWWCGRRKGVSAAAAASAGGAAPASTGARAGGAGGRWIWARSARSWRPRRRGCCCRRARRGGGAPCPGRATAPASPARSRTRWRGWRCTPPRRRSRELLRVAWRTVGRIVARVAAEAEPGARPLRRAARGSASTRSPTAGPPVPDGGGRPRHRPAGVGRARPRRRPRWAVLRRARPRSAAQQIRLVSADAAEWIASAVAERCPPRGAVPGPVPRRPAGPPTRWTRSAARSGTPPASTARRRWPASSRAPGTRCGRTPRTSPAASGQARPDRQVNQRLYRAYLLKEQLRLMFRLKGEQAIVLLDAWLAWARRCRIPAFVKLARTITEHRAGIEAALAHGLSNGLRRGGQHQDPPAHPRRVRLPLARRADRPRHAQPSAACAHPCPDEPDRTHGSSRRAYKRGLGCGLTLGWRCDERGGHDVPWRLMIAGLREAER